jgi:hypothetical protein
MCVCVFQLHLKGVRDNENFFSEVTHVSLETFGYVVVKLPAVRVLRCNLHHLNTVL